MPDFTQKYNTRLSPLEEKAYNTWVAQNNRGNDVYDYDLRGAWKELMSGQMTQAENGHLGDKYKKPNHPTFSDESIYHGVDGYYGGTWGQSPDVNQTTFTPSETNLKNMSPKALQRYFDRIEPDVKLLLPQTGK